MRPQLANPRTKAPSGDNSLHEIRYDGYRLQIHQNRGQGDGLHPQRAGLDEALLGDRLRIRHPVERAILDGEVVVTHAEEEWTFKGIPNSVLLAKPLAPAQIVTAIAQLNLAPPGQPSE